MSSISPAPQGEVGQSHLSRHILVWGPRFGVSLWLQMQEEPTRGTRRFSLLLLLLRLKPNRTWSSHRRVHPTEESPALLTAGHDFGFCEPICPNLRSRLSYATIGLFERRDKS
jgi:hypothetical protein